MDLFKLGVEIDPKAAERGAQQVEQSAKRLEASLKSAGRGADQLRPALNRVGGAAEREAQRLGVMARSVAALQSGMRNLWSTAVNLRTALALAAVAFYPVSKAAGFLGDSIRVSADFETAKSKLAQLRGSYKEAAAEIQRVKKVADNSPFQLPELLAANLAMQQLIPKLGGMESALTKIGDAAAFTGADFEFVARAYNKLFNELENKLNFGESIQSLREMRVLDAGAVARLQGYAEISQRDSAPADTWAKAWVIAEKNLMKYQGSMAVLAKTWNGLTSTLEDYKLGFKLAIGTPIMDEAKPLLVSRAKFYADMTKWAEQYDDQIRGVTKTLVTMFAVFSDPRNAKETGVFMLGILKSIGGHLEKILEETAKRAALLAAKGFVSAWNFIMSDADLMQNLTKTLFEMAEVFGKAISVALKKALEDPALRQTIAGIASSLLLGRGLSQILAPGPPVGAPAALPGVPTGAPAALPAASAALLGEINATTAKVVEQTAALKEFNAAAEAGAPAFQKFWNKALPSEDIAGGKSGAALKASLEAFIDAFEKFYTNRGIEAPVSIVRELQKAQDALDAMNGRAANIGGLINVLLGDTDTVTKNSYASFERNLVTPLESDMKRLGEALPTTGTGTGPTAALFGGGDTFNFGSRGAESIAKAQEFGGAIAATGEESGKTWGQRFYEGVAKALGGVAPSLEEDFLRKGAGNEDLTHPDDPAKRGLTDYGPQPGAAAAEEQKKLKAAKADEAKDLRNQFDSNYSTATKAYRRELAELNSYLDQGIISKQEYYAAATQMNTDYFEALRREAASNPFAALMAEWGDISAAGQQAAADITQALGSGISNGLGDIATQTKSVSEAFREMGASIVNDITRIIIQMTIQYYLTQLIKGAQIALGLGGAGTGTTTAAVSHDGRGEVRRPVASTVFLDAHRYHGGGSAGLKPGEVPAVLERGELVMTREQQAATRARLGERASAPTGANVSILNVTDPRQVEAALLANPDLIVNLISRRASAVRRVIGKTAKPL